MENAESLESLFSLAPAMLWSIVAACGVFYFIYSYLYEILAQKLDAPRWMAWVPIANVYLMFRLVGWQKWFVMSIGGFFLAGLLMAMGPLAFLGMLILIPAILAMIVMSLVYWPKLAMQRGLPAVVGLLLVLPQFLVPVFQAIDPSLGLGMSALSTLLAVGAFLAIVFHDGGPENAPHVVGYVCTVLLCAVLGGGAYALQDKVLEDPEFKSKLQTLAMQMKQANDAANAEAGGASDEDASALLASLASWSGSDDVPVPSSFGEMAASSGGSPATTEPPPHALPKGCPDDAQPRKGPYKGGRATWCELENGGEIVRHGPMRTWDKRGYLSDEGSYFLGQRSGTWTRYNNGGIREVQAEFHNGVQHGWMHRWDEAGNLKTGVYYENGKPSSRPTGDVIASQ